MKPRNWKPDAWWLAVKNGYPGSVPVVEKAMEHGYQLGLKDATEEFAKLREKIAEDKRRGNEQR